MHTTPRTFLGLTVFDRLVIAAEALFFLPFVREYLISRQGFFAGTIALLFFVGLYLKRYDPTYPAGVAQVSDDFSPTGFIMFIGGFFVGAILFALLFMVDAISLLSLVLSVEEGAVREHWATMLIALPLTFAAAAYIPGMYIWAGSGAKNFVKHVGKKRVVFLRWVSQVFIAMQAAYLLVFLANTAAPTGEAIQTLDELIMNFLVMLFMTALFYFPIKLHDFFTVPANKHSYWTEYIKISFILALVSIGFTSFL